MRDEIVHESGEGNTVRVRKRIDANTFDGKQFQN